MSPSAANPAAAKAAARTGISSALPPRRSVMVGRGVGGCVVGAGAAALVGAVVGACALARAPARLTANRMPRSTRFGVIVESVPSRKREA